MPNVTWDIELHVYIRLCKQLLLLQYNSAAVNMTKTEPDLERKKYLKCFEKLKLKNAISGVPTAWPLTRNTKTTKRFFYVFVTKIL